MLEGPHVRCDRTSDTSRFQPTLSEHLRTLFGIVRARPDVSVYHCLFTPNPRASQTLKLVLNAMRRPVIHTVCSSPPDWAAAKPLLFADVVVTVSDWARQQLVQLGMNNVRHIRPGIAMPVASDAAVLQLRKELDLSPDRPCLVFSGDYEFSGAHPALLAALPGIVKAFPEVVLVFACRTKTGQALEIEATVRQDVSTAGLTRNVRFLRHVDDFASLLALATVVLFPAVSLHKKMDIPLTLLEALALRKPIVATTFGPLAELMAEPVGTGIPTGDASALEAAVVDLLRNPQRATAMANAGHQLVREQYSAEAMARAYEDLYLSLAPGGRA